MIVRHLLVLVVALTALVPSAWSQGSVGSPATFGPFLDQLWPDAKAKGITRTTFDAAFAGLTPDPRVMAAIRNQPEYGKPIGAYLASIVSAGNMSMGLRKAGEWAAVFDRVEKTY